MNSRTLLIRTLLAAMGSVVFTATGWLMVAGALTMPIGWPCPPSPGGPGARRVRPIAMAAGRRVEARWAELTSPRKIDSLRRELQALLTRVQREDSPSNAAGSG